MHWQATRPSVPSPMLLRLWDVTVMPVALSSAPICGENFDQRCAAQEAETNRH
jgi:hypothetical protein